MDTVLEITKCVSFCLLPKLSRNAEEINNHPEYYDRKNYLETYFPRLIEIVSKENLNKHSEFTANILPSLIILYFERSLANPWNSPKCMDYARTLNKSFHNTYSFSLDSALISNDHCNVQEVFDSLLQELNKKLVKENFKLYPGLIDVYCTIVKNIKDYKIVLDPVTLFPICLLLIEDYVNINKIKGLKCCFLILPQMNEKHFQNGNYYEVILSSLKKTIHEKEIEVTKLVQRCLVDFIKIVPDIDKKAKIDDIFGIMLEQLHLESNLHRKTICLRLVKYILSIHGVNCVNKKLLKTVLIENINICCNDAVADILLVDVLQCLRVWIEECWCVWRLSTDHKMLSALIKLLYVSRKEKIAVDIQHLIVSLIMLCTEKEQKKIHNNLLQSQITSPEFQEKLEEIKRDISK